MVEKSDFCIYLAILPFTGPREICQSEYFQEAFWIGCGLIFWHICANLGQNPRKSGNMSEMKTFVYVLLFYVQKELMKGVGPMLKLGHGDDLKDIGSKTRTDNETLFGDKGQSEGARKKAAIVAKK